MDSIYFAHSANRADKWHPLAEHLIEVGRRAKQFGEATHWFDEAALAGGYALPVASCANTRRDAWKTLQTSFVAGFQYHSGEALWSLATGQPLTLTRETDNPHGPRAVRVDWQGYKPGYIPRLDSAAVSQLLERGEMLGAVIAKLENSGNPWDRVGVEVRWKT